MNGDLSPVDLERLRELLAEKAAFGLDTEDAAEVERLLGRQDGADAEEFERVAAALLVAFAPADAPPLPEALRRRCVEQAREVLSPKSDARIPRPAADRRSTWPPPWLGWAAAAACLLVAVATWLRPSPTAPTDDPAQARRELLASRGVLTVPLAGVGPDSAARGDLVWSNDRQRGFMRLTGVPVNDPSRRQYQLWIFDKAQDERYPVDGGVFDVGTSGELIVPIRAPIRVVEPYLFAVTAEKPGGVVVSRRDPIVLLGEVAKATTR